MKRSSLTLLSFLASSFLVLSASAKVVDRSVVTVNDEVILESDIAKFQTKVRSKSFQELFGGMDPKALKDRESILQLLIEEKIINQQVKKLELTATDAEVDAQIRVIQKRNGISPAQLTERLKQLGTTMADYKEGIRRQIERRNLIEREIKPTLEVSDEQLRHYYLRNLRAEDSTTQYRIAHILIENKAKAGISAQERAKTIHKELEANPGNFAAMVKEYSDDTSTPDGLLGDFSATQMAKEFREVVPKTAVGKVTAPIKTAAGYHIVKVLESHAGDYTNLPKDRKEALRNQMVSEELEKRMAMWLDRKKGESYIRASNTATPAKETNKQTN